VSPDAPERLTVSEAARRLGVTQDAVRKRIQRGTIRYERDDESRLYVWVDPSETAQDSGQDTTTDKLLRVQEAEIDFLRRELENRTEEIRRRDVIISQLTSRIPEIEAPGSPEPREAPTEATEQPGRVEPQPSVEGTQEGAQPRSWWRRMFGG